MSFVTGILHPGEMGAYLAASARNTLGKVYWCAEGRSAATQQRAEQQQLSAIATLAEFCRTCELIIGVCPPHAARSQAQALCKAGFKGLYVEANAIAPQTVHDIAALLAASGITCIDGGIVGLPTGQPNATTLYLSGPGADAVASCFGAGPLAAKVLPGGVGAASALKLCYAAWNKGSTALLTTVLAMAEANGVREALQQQWEVHEPGFNAHGSKRVSGVARKAWRFGPEMREIAALLQDSSLPPDFFTGAAELYERLEDYKDVTTAPALAELLQKVLQHK
jgi:3-hydroxyisobutyrate dehydrogenase-like beta-hydroxyacid dehydrogenase